MHRVIRDHLEEVLSGDSASRGSQDFELHLQNCADCRDQIAAMRRHSVAMRQLKADAEPRAGFYARVLERIDAQRPGSIWNVFSESPFGKRIALASMALALILGIYVATSEHYSDEQPVSSAQTMTLPGEDQAAVVLTGDAARPDRDAVLVNLVTYKEQ